MARTPAGQRQLLERMSISLIQRTAEELEKLHQKTGMSKTDIVNRAISLFAFVTQETDSGKQLLVRDPQSGEVQVIQLF